MRALCERIGERPADVALAWLLHQPAVTAPIIGPRTMEQLRPCDAEPGSLTRTAEALDAIFPAPEAQPRKPMPGNSESLDIMLQEVDTRNLIP